MTKQELRELKTICEALLKEQLMLKSKLKTIRNLIRVLQLLYSDNKLADDSPEGKDMVVKMLISAIENATLLPTPGLKN